MTEGMSLDQYQQWTESTAVYPRIDELPYLTLGLVGEAGEIANKVKKILRDQNGVMTIGDMDAISDELGDCLWYLARLADITGNSLTMIVRQNVEKLEDRKRRGVLGGSGDQR